MVLSSNKKLKQKIRAQLTDSYISSSQNTKQSFKSLLDSLTQKPRLSKRVKRRVLTSSDANQENGLGLDGVKKKKREEKLGLDGLENQENGLGLEGVKVEKKRKGGEKNCLDGLEKVGLDGLENGMKKVKKKKKREEKVGLDGLENGVKKEEGEGEEKVKEVKGKMKKKKKKGKNKKKKSDGVEKGVEVAKAEDRVDEVIKVTNSKFCDSMARTNIHIPEELLVKILLPQPVKSLVQWRCVCKLWNQVITRWSFIKSYGVLHITCTDIRYLESFPAMVAAVFSDDGYLQLEATTHFRELVSRELNSPIKLTGVVTRFVEFLGRDDYPPQLQYEAAWALTNIASGTSGHTKVVIDHGAIPVFVRLLTSASDDVREQIVWALGNIAADSSQCRDLVLAHGALIPLLAQFNKNARITMLRTATWTLSNLCGGKPQPHFEQTMPALPALAKLLVTSTDEEVLTYACKAFCYLADGTNDKIQAVIDSGVCGRLVELLYHPSPSVLFPALHTVGKIVKGDDMQTQVIIQHQALVHLLKLLTNDHKKCIKEVACWTISNITAGNNEQIQAVIEAGIIRPLVQLLGNAEFEIKKEAAWAVANATAGGTHEQIKFLVSQGCIEPLCDLLDCPDPIIVTIASKGLEEILKVGEAEKNLGHTGGVNVYEQLINEAKDQDLGF